MRTAIRPDNTRSASLALLGAALGAVLRSDRSAAAVGAQAQAPEAEAARGAFGQRTDGGGGGGEVAPQNRAERRAQERKGR